MKIGLFGGTFNPVHLGHVDMIEQVCLKIHLDKIFFIPAFIPPHKLSKEIVDYSKRFYMLQLALNKKTCYNISNVEQKVNRPSYTIYTIKYYKNIYPDDELFYILGVDAFNKIESWYHWEELIALCHFIVVDRAGSQLKINKKVQNILDKSDFNIYHLNIKTLPISSSDIRKKLKEGLDVKSLLDINVYDYVISNRLYAGECNGL